MAKIGASVICMDPLDLANDIMLCNELGVDYFHIDVMDGHFVPRFGIYPEICGHIARISDIPLDIHLMVTDPEFAIDIYGKFENVESISFHYEAQPGNVLRIIDKIKEKGKKAGIAINMSTPLNVLDRIFHELDFILFMGIHPGVINQKQRRWLVSDIICTVSRPLITQVDGQVSFDNLLNLRKAGANSFVCGNSTLFSNSPYLSIKNKEEVIKYNYRKIKECIS